jgi:hypothetical protein
MKPEQGIPGETVHRQDLASALRSTPKLKRNATTIEAARYVREHGYVRYQGQLLDITTAHMLITVYEALNEVNREKFAALPLLRAVSVGWKLVGSK